MRFPRLVSVFLYFLCLRLACQPLVGLAQNSTATAINQKSTEDVEVGIVSQANDREWPFYVPKHVTPPEVTPDQWIRNDIDRFVLQSLHEHNLQPADEASKRTLIRRLYFDLLGLPPTPADIKTFLEDQAEDAYQKLVSRLLDDPRYGERWARFWLDLARYADTAGYEGDPDLPQAWRYRDYVIDSLNKDKPYDQFIKEQIAGDEFKEIMGAGDLPSTPAEHIVAMTFLRLAPFTEPRGDETRHEMLSEITSTVGSVFLGLTVGCAKCHDHKHDEIPTSDFYRMKAFFATVQIPRPEAGDIYQIGGPIDAEFYRDGEKDWAEQRRQQLQQQSAEAAEKLTALKQRIASRLGVDITNGAGAGIQVVNNSGNDYVFAKQVVNDGKPHLAIINSDGKAWSISADNGKKTTLGSLSGKNLGKWFASLSNPQQISLGQHTAGTGNANGDGHLGKFAEIMIYDHPLTDEESNRLTKYFAGKYNTDSGTSSKPVDSNFDSDIPRNGLKFWLDANDLDGDKKSPNPKLGTSIDSWVDRVGKLELNQSLPELQPKLSTLGLNGSPAVEFTKDFLQGSAESASFLPDKQGAIAIVYSATHSHEGYGLEVSGDKEFLSTVVNPGAAVGDDRIDALMKDVQEGRVTADERRQFEFLSTRQRFVPMHLKRLRPVAMSLRHSYGPPFEPGVPVTRIMIRGEYNHPGDVVEPGFLSVITGNEDPAPIRLDPFKRWPTRSRRMALAEWIASPDNPMTARVMVNRLWHWHFGQGIVTTPSDFGTLSDSPSHQALLDWLAIQFVESKWSLKTIHRLIVNSATYRQSSARFDTAAFEEDPDNRLLWRFNRRRLEAEAVRDSVLAVSGRLNPEQYGLPIFPPLPGDVAEAVKYNNSKWDAQYGPEGRKRSLYIYQQRTLTMPLMQTFDALVCDESRPRRRHSVTPLQALAMYNGEFTNEEAKHFAARVARVAETDTVKQIQTAFELALGRLPNDQELTFMGQLLEATDENESTETRLLSVCRVLLNTNEFLYVD